METNFHRLMVQGAGAPNDEGMLPRLPGWYSQCGTQYVPQDENPGMQQVVRYSLPGSMLVVIISPMPCGGHGFMQLAEGVLPPSRTISQRQSRMPLMRSVTSFGNPKTYAMP